MPPLDPAEISLYRSGSTLPPEYWEALLRRDSETVCRNALVEYVEAGVYRVPFIGDLYGVHPGQKRIHRIAEPDRQLSFQHYLVLLVYLLEARDLPLSRDWVNEKELTGGALFFQGPHALSREPLERRFARDPRGLLRAGLSLGGVASAKGDASFVLRALPRVPLEYIFYAADEEFPARLIITFDRTADRHLPLDVIWALVNLTSHRVWQAGGGEERGAEGRE